MKLGIVGYGFVGQAIGLTFGNDHQVVVYDPFKFGYADDTAMREINTCDLAFVAVPTPPRVSDGACDLAAVEETFTWLRVPACIKSTVPPGTTRRMSELSGQPVAFSPEYIGESHGHRWNTIVACGFVIVGGEKAARDPIVTAYSELTNTESLSIYETDSVTAELCKYMENTFLATKVAFVNQFYDFAGCLGVDFDELTRLWHLDTRIGESHSAVTSQRGFGGRCLPKDMAAIIAHMRPYCSVELLEAVREYNEHLRAVPVRASGNGHRT